MSLEMQNHTQITVIIDTSEGYKVAIYVIAGARGISFLTAPTSVE
jgi:hypothetical protein